MMIICQNFPRICEPVSRLQMCHHQIHRDQINEEKTKKKKINLNILIVKNDV